MRCIDLDQGSEKWLQWRKTRLTATSASILMDMNPFKTINDLWEEMLGITPPKPANEKMKRGNALEPIARDLLIKETGIDFKPICCEHDQDWWMAASLDGISPDHEIVCEIKCPKMQTHLETVADQKIPEFYFAQCQHQLFVTGAQKVLYTSYHPDCIDNDFLCIVEVLPDPGFIEELRKRAKDFYENCLCQMSPPASYWFFSSKN